MSSRSRGGVAADRPVSIDRVSDCSRNTVDRDGRPDDPRRCAEIAVDRPDAGVGRRGPRAGPATATPCCWRTTTSCRRSRTSPTTPATRWRCPGSRPQSTASTIVFCGVHFMAETAKILAPDKTVLIPDANAGCSLADSITADQLRAWKAEHPGAVVVSYVNTTAAVKAETDICCTSSNAVEVVASIPADREVLFLPDQFLGAHVRRITGRDNMHVWAGECHVHAGINGADADRAGRRRTRTPSCTCTRSAAAPPRRCTWPAPARCPPTGSRSCPPAGCSTRPGRATRAGAGGHRGRHAAPAAQGRPGGRLPGGERARVLPLHEDDHPGRAAARRCARARDEVHVDPELAARGRAAVQRMIEIGRPGGGE